MLTLNKTGAMVSFAEIVKTVEHLSDEEIDELREILRRKKEEEIFIAVEEVRQESKEGKTTIFSSPDQIKEYFEKLAEDAN